MISPLSKTVKKCQNKLTPAEKANFRLDYLESLILNHISTLEKIQQDIQQENHNDSQYIEQKYRQKLIKMLEEYQKLSKNVEQIKCRSIQANDSS